MLACALSAVADTVLVFGFDNNDEPNGIQYNGIDQFITFSGAVSATAQTNFFPMLDNVDSTVNFSINAVGDLQSAFSGMITPVGGVFTMGASGAGIDSGSGSAYFDQNSEAFTFVFSQDVRLTSATYWGDDEGGQTILVNGVAVSGSPFMDFIGENIFVGAGDTLTFGHAGSGTYALDEFQITVVPEPATLALIGIGGLLALVERRIRLLRRG